MSWLDDLAPQQEKANAEGALKFTDAPPVPGFLTNAGEGFKGLPKGLVDAANTADTVFSAAGAAIERVAGITPVPGSMGDRAANDAAAPAMREQYRREYGIDAATTGTAGQILYEVNKIIPRTVVGSALAGPVGGAFAAGAPEGQAAYADAVDSGIDADTATSLGVTRGATTGIGAILPGSGVVKNAALDLAATTGLNVGLGVLDRYASGAILREGGYEAQAAQYDALDGQAVAVDAVLGAAFWGVGRSTSAPTPSKSEVNAALALNADLQRRTAGLGLPVDPASAKAHGDAIDGAVEALLRGERVDVGEAIRNATFLRRPVAPVAAAVRRGYEPASPGFDASVARILNDEGGFVDDPADRGGATNFGISSRANSDVDVANLTREDAIDLYRDRYWNAINADELPADMQGAAFDAAVNQGVGWTRKALAEAAGDPAAFIALREARYREIVANDPSQAKFLRGWLNRVGRYKETSPAGAALRERLVKDPEALFAEYATRPDAMGGVVLNTDVARELSPEYLSDRTRSADVHEAASDTIKTLYEQRLAGPTPEGMDRTVMFTAGGTGAGKTSAIEAMGDALGRPEIVYDTNMNTLSSAVEKVEQALKAGRDVSIAYVYRDPVEALTGGAIPRAQRQAKEFGSGRTVPLSEHAKTHAGVRDVMESLAKKYENDPRVTIAAIDNSRGKGNQEMVELASLPKVEQNTLNERLQEALDQARAAGLDEATYRGFASQGRGAQPALARNRLADQSQARRQEAVTPPSGLGAAGLDVPRVRADAAAPSRTTPNLMDPDGPAPKIGASGLPESPAIAAASQAATLDPSLTIALDDGTTLSAADALAALAREQAQAEIDASGYLAAANCFLRSA